MDQKKDFLDQPIDRTPYSGFIWLAVLVIGVFWLGASLLWNLAGQIKKGQGVSGLFSSDKNLTSAVNSALRTSSSPLTLPNQLQNQLQSQIDAAGKSAAASAGQAIKQQVQNQAQKALSSAIPTLP